MLRFARAITVVASLLLPTAEFAHAAQPTPSGQPVKKSKTGICHAPGTTYYEQTKGFTPFATLDDCLKSGGRLPKR